MTRRPRHFVRPCLKRQSRNTCKKAGPQRTGRLQETFEYSAFRKPCTLKPSMCEPEHDLGILDSSPVVCQSNIEARIFRNNTYTISILSLLLSPPLDLQGVWDAEFVDRKGTRQIKSGQQQSFQTAAPATQASRRKQLTTSAEGIRILHVWASAEEG